MKLNEPEFVHRLLFSLESEVHMLRSTANLVQHPQVRGMLLSAANRISELCGMFWQMSDRGYDGAIPPVNRGDVCLAEFGLDELPTEQEKSDE